MPLGFTNSLTNYMMSGSKGAPQPEVGMGATELLWTDRNPYTVVEVINEKTLRLRPCRVTRYDEGGYAKEFEELPTADTILVTLRKNGRWVRRGESLKNGTAYRIGERLGYRDPHF
jgi:hypothetical protein